MENEKNVNAGSGVKKVEFVKLREVTKDNIQDFCGGLTYDTTLAKSVNTKTGNVSYSLVIRLNNKISINTRINEATYELICAERGKDTDVATKHTFKSPCRIVKGKRNDDSYYYMVDCFLAEDYRQSFFLDDNQVKLINILKGMNLRIIDKPETSVEELKEILYPESPYGD